MQLHEIILDFISFAEKKLNRKLTNAQKSGLGNCGSLMMFEAIISGFQCAKSEEDIQKWLNEVDEWETYRLSKFTHSANLHLPLNLNADS